MSTGDHDGKQSVLVLKVRKVVTEVVHYRGRMHERAKMLSRPPMIGFEWCRDMNRARCSTVIVAFGCCHDATGTRKIDVCDRCHVERGAVRVWNSSTTGPVATTRRFPRVTKRSGAMVCADVAASIRQQQTQTGS